MTRKMLIAGILAMALLTAGCTAMVVGAGAGAGVYSYIEGELKRTYPAGIDPATNASLQALEHLKIRVESRDADGITTTVKAKRPNGIPVTVRLTMLSPRVTEIGIRTGYVGLWDRRVSETIHATIAQRLI